MHDVSEIPSPANPRIFAPSEEKAKEVLNALACGEYSFVEIAQNHDTNVEALSAWMATDEVEQRLAMIETGPARQARLVATIRMPDAVRALTAALDNLRFEEEHAVTDHRNQRIRELRRRGADTLRKVVALLHRITRFHPLPEGGGRGKGSLRATASSSNRATASSLLGATSSAGRHTRSETPSDPSVPLDLLDSSAPSANPPAPITPESIEELRAFLQTLFTPSPNSVTPSLDHSATSTPPSPAPLHPSASDALPPSRPDALFPEPPRTKPIKWTTALHSRAGTTNSPSQTPITPASNGHHPPAPESDHPP